MNAVIAALFSEFPHPLREPKPTWRGAGEAGNAEEIRMSE
jgi:hypothetical protein